MPYDETAVTDTDDDQELDDEPEAADEQSSGFVLEARLEEFLVGNWKSIGWGRPLEIWTGPDGQSGHQLVTPVGRLDFLCSDHQADALIVGQLVIHATVPLSHLPCPNASQSRTASPTV